jgi:DNA polymerase I-like protein with 3'-5' exonuclease and polymerase domains
VARVQYDIPMLLPEGQLIWSTYQNTYKGVPRFWETQIRTTAAKGYVETLAGRRIQVKGDWSGKNRWRMQSTSINTPIQGTGADQKYLALLCVKNTLHNTGSYFFLDMHDGLYFLVPDDNVRQFCDETKDVLDNLPYAEAWGFKPPVPLPFDCKVGKSWGSLQEYRFA